MTKTPATFPDPCMPIIPYLGIKRPKIYAEMTYLEKNKTNEFIRQNLRNKYFYESDMHEIYNLIVDQINKQLQENAVLDATFQVLKTDQEPIGYLMILNRIYFTNHSNHHPIGSLCLATRRLYNTMQYANENTTDYLFRFHNAQKFNEARNGSLITRDLQYCGIKTIFPLHTT